MRCRQGVQEAEAVLSDLAGVSFPLRRALRQPCVLDPAAIALVPSRGGQGAQPIRSNSRRGIEGARNVSATSSSRLRVRTAASTCVESVLCRPRALRTPSSRATSSTRSSRRSCAPPARRRSRNSQRTLKSKPGSDSSRPRRYLGSPDRTGTDSLQADKAGTSGGCQGGQGCRAAPESPETVVVEFAVAGPEVIAGEIDVAPAQGREMGEGGLRHWDTVPTERVQGAAEIDGVPQHDGRGDQREPAGAMLLGFGATIAHAAEAVEAHGAGQRIARFALVQFRSGTPAQLRIAEPVEHQQGALNAADFAQRQGEAILP